MEHLQPVENRGTNL